MKRTDAPCRSRLCLIWHHWLNPLGNWNEPNPTPGKRRVQAAESKLPAGLWWALRNPLHNFNHYWIGITPIGEHGAWRQPYENGWTRHDAKGYSYWQKGRIKLPIYKWTGKRWEGYIGWMSRGNFGMALRRKHD